MTPFARFLLIALLAIGAMGSLPGVGHGVTPAPSCCTANGAASCCCTHCECKTSADACVREAPGPDSSLTPTQTRPQPSPPLLPCPGPLADGRPSCCTGEPALHLPSGYRLLLIDPPRA